MKKLARHFTGTLSLIVLICLLVGCGSGLSKDYQVLVNKENKIPDDWETRVELIEEQNPYGEARKVEKQAYIAFLGMREALLKKDIHIEVDGAYRNIDFQQDVWDEFEKEYGEEYAKKYVAVPGYSEHHTGLAIDICIEKDGKRITDNEAMLAEKEIFAEIHKVLPEYGFILRYPEGKEDITGYGYEPWHLRFVGGDTAKEIAEKGITLEEYLK